MPSCLPLLSDGSRQASLNALPPLSAEDSKLFFYSLSIVVPLILEAMPCG